MRCFVLQCRGSIRLTMLHSRRFGQLALILGHQLSIINAWPDICFTGTCAQGSYDNFVVLKPQQPCFQKALLYSYAPNAP